MGNLMYKGSNVGGSANYAAAVSCVAADGSESTVQAEIDKVNEVLFGEGDGGDGEMNMNAMVQALYDDLQQGRPVSHEVFNGIGVYTLTFDKSYSKFIVFINNSSTNNITDVRLNDSSIGCMFNVIGSTNLGYSLYMAIYDINVKAGDILTLHCNAGNSGYNGAVVVY